MSIAIKSIIGVSSCKSRYLQTPSPTAQLICSFEAIVAKLRPYPYLSLSITINLCPCDKGAIASPKKLPLSK